MSSRNRLACEGYGPTVSLGVTAQLDVPPAEGVVVVGVVLSLGLVGVSPPQPKPSAAPAAPKTSSASRRPIVLWFMIPFNHRDMTSLCARYDKSAARTTSVTTQRRGRFTEVMPCSQAEARGCAMAAPRRSGRYLRRCQSTSANL